MKNIDYNRYDKNRPSVKLFDNFLNEVDHIAYERDYWKSQAQKWENKYNLLIRESIKQSNELTGQILSAFLHKADEVSK
jgi:hypothetical protein